MIIIYLALVLFAISLFIYTVKYLPEKRKKRKKASLEQIIWSPQNVENEQNNKNLIKKDYTEDVAIEYLENNKIKKAENREKVINIKIYNTKIDVSNRLI